MHRVGREIQLVQQELVLVQNINAVVLGGGCREVLQILGDQQLGASAHCRRENVPIFRVVRHGVDKLLVTRDLGVGEMPGHLPQAMCHLFVRRASLAQVAIELDEYAGRPQWAVQTGFGDREDRVAQVWLKQYTGVEEDG